MVRISQTPNPWKITELRNGATQPGMAAGNDGEHWEFFFLGSFVVQIFYSQIITELPEFHPLMGSMGKGSNQGKSDLGAGTQLWECLLQSDARGKYFLIFLCSDKSFRCVQSVSQSLCSYPGTRSSRDWNEMSGNIHYLPNLEAERSWFGNSHKTNPSQFHLILSGLPSN